jgi:hypothetical protein
VRLLRCTKQRADNGGYAVLDDRMEFCLYRTVHPDLERFAAKRMGARTYEVASSHVPMLSNPKLVVDVIRTAANAVADTQASKRA